MKFRLLGPGGRVWRIIRFVKQIKRQRDFEHQFHIGGNKHRNMHFYVIGINQGEEGLFSICLSSFMSYRICIATWYDSSS